MVPVPPTSGSDVVRVLTLVGFVRAQRGGPVVRLERGYRSVVAIDSADLMAPEDIRALLHEADVPISVFLDLLDRIAEEHAG